MKKIFLNIKTVGLMAIVASALTLNSCGNAAKCTDERDDNYNSTTNECDELATVNKFVASYQVSEACGSNNSNFTCNITKSTTTAYRILISNFAGVFVNNVIADVSQNEITIPNQEPDNDDYRVQGSGSLNSTGNILTISYTVTNPSNQNTSCTATFTKQ